MRESSTVVSGNDWHAPLVVQLKRNSKMLRGHWFILFIYSFIYLFGCRVLAAAHGILPGAHGFLSSCGTQAQLPHSIWDLPRPGIGPASPALKSGFLLVHSFQMYKRQTLAFKKRAHFYRELMSFWTSLPFGKLPTSQVSLDNRVKQS